MRTSINIPDEYADKIKASLSEKGFNTLNEYILQLIRNNQQQKDVVTTEVEKTTQKIEVIKLPPDTILNKNTEWPPTYLGKPLSGKNQPCPVCSDDVPIEFAQAHYAKRHSDI